MRASMWTLVLPLTLTVACKRPPDAPQELSDLAGFLFEHMMDDDDELLVAGLDNLAIWMEDNELDANEGYSVTELDAAVIESVNPNRSGDLGDVGGAAVAARIGHNVMPIARTLVLENQAEVFDQYKSHVRTYRGDPDCFMSKECDRLTTDNEVESKFSILTTRTMTRAQFRWVETDMGSVLMHRTWLTRPADVSPNIVAVNEQLYVGVTMPWTGGSLRVGTTWVAVEILGGLNEALALQMMIDSMSKEAETLDTYLD